MSPSLGYWWGMDRQNSSTYFPVGWESNGPWLWGRHFQNMQRLSPMPKGAVRIVLPIA